MPKIKVSRACFIDGIYRQPGEEFDVQGDVPPFAKSLEAPSEPSESAEEDTKAAGALLGGDNA